MNRPDGYLARGPLLAPSAFALLARLNRYFIDLLLADRRSADALLPVTVMDLLQATGDSQRDAMAACPYSLFRLEFPADDRYGTDLPLRVHDPPEGPYGGQPSGAGWPAFVTAAWFFAWHLSRSSPLAVRLTLGMVPDVVSRLAELDPWQLHRLTGDEPGPLPPRWSGNPCFWPDLVRSAREADPARLFVARLLGIQLLAAEMAGITPP